MLQKILIFYWQSWSYIINSSIKLFSDLYLAKFLDILKIVLSIFTLGKLNLFLNVCLQFL